MTPDFAALVTNKDGFVQKGWGARRRDFARLLARGRQISDELVAYAAASRARVAEIDRQWPEAEITTA